MGRNRADTLIKQYGKNAPLSVNEADALASKIFAGKPASREEAEILLGVSALFDANDAAWRHIVVQQVHRHMLQDCGQGVLQDGVEDWLIATLATTQSTEAMTLDLVQVIMQNASNATERLGRLGLHSALNCMKAVAPQTVDQQANTA